MKAAQGTLGRVFVLRLEDGDRLPECLEDYAKEQGVSRAVVNLLGGAGGGALVVGPEDGKAAQIKGMTRVIPDVHEVAAVGTLFPNEAGEPKLHMHAAMGREDKTITGCVRLGVDIWKVAEAVIIEITGMDTTRKIDPSLGLELLSPE